MHFKANPLRNQANLNVDREKGIIRNISIAEFGVNKNDTYFSEKFLQDLANGANEQKQGVKSRFGHPNMCSTTLGTYLGRYKDFRYENEKVVADLYLDDVSKKTEVDGKGITMFEYVMDMAENNPDMFGNSIALPSVKFEKELVNIEGVEYQSHIYTGIVASDLVDDPAATSGLFSNSDDLGVIATDFLDENPQIFELFESKPEIIIDFFGRYENYINSKSQKKMSFFDKLKRTLSAKFDVELTLADNSIVTVVTDNEKPQVGDKVNDADGKPVADGEHMLADGSAIVTANGEITDIKEKAADEPADPEPSPEFEALKTKFEQFSNDTENSIQLIANSISDLNRKFSTLAKSIGSKPIENFESEDLKNKQGVKLSAYERALAQKEAKENK